MRLCRKCGCLKLLVDFYFRKDSQKYKEVCKDCCKAKAKEYQITHSEEIANRKRNRYQENRENVLEKNRKHRAENATIYNAKERIRYQENPDLFKGRSKDYRQRNVGSVRLHDSERYFANKEKYLKYAKEYRQRNLHRLRWQRREWYAKNSEKSSARCKEFNRRHPEAYVLYHHRHRAKKYGSEGSFSISDLRHLKNKHGGICAYCQKSFATTIDHVIPLVRGGSNYIGNLLPACASCNSSKKDKTIMEWRMMKLRGYRFSETFKL